MLFRLFSGISPKKAAGNILGALILAVGVYNIHSIAQITEGGVVGLTLLLRHFRGISPAVSSFILTALCYVVGFRTFGRSFLVYSGIAAGSYSVFYALLELTPRVYPEIAAYPLLAALLGACFIGAGAGICVKCGGAQSGDDALAMSLSDRFHVRISAIYLISDLSVLALSLTYIPPLRLVYSLLTVVLSGQIIALINRSPAGADSP